MAAGIEALTVTQDFEVSAEELVRTLQRRGIPLPSEIGAFVVLEACERLAGRPALISTRDIFITEHGDVECAERPRHDTEAAAATALLGVLAELLVGAAPGVPNMLLDLVEHGPNEERLSLALLRSDLEACLLPLNRGATRRVLSRLVREIRKAAPGAIEQAESLEVGDVDAAFDHLLGETSPPPGAARRKQARARAERSAGELPRGIGSERPASGAAGLPRGVTSDRPASEGSEQRADGSEAARRAAFGKDAAQPRKAAAEAPSRLHIPAEETALQAPRRQRGRNRSAAQADAADADSGESPRRAPGSGAAADSGDVSRRERVPVDAADSGESARRASEAESGDPLRGRRHDERDAYAESPRQVSERPPRSAAPRSRAPLDVDALVEAQATRGRVGLWVFLGTTAAAVAMLLGYFALGREQTQSALGFLKPAEHDEVTAAKPQAPARRAYGDLRVNSQPDRAQVFLLIGPGPALATDIPLGVAQEFVAMAEGYRPARALLPADAVWDELEGQPRYELAIQARPINEGRRFRSPEALGPTLLPQSVGAPTGRLGSVRVVTTPRAARVYQLIGFTPEVHVDNLPLDHAYELLVYQEGRSSVRKRVEPADFQAQVGNGKRVAQVDAQLPAAE